MDERLRRAIGDERFDVVVEVLDVIERDRALWPHELLLRARALQLRGAAESRYLIAAQETLEKISESDPEYVPALVELGWFHLNVRGQAGDAITAFEKALTVASATAAEALVGLSRCTEESGSRDGAIRLLRQRSVVDQELVREELERLSGND